MTGLLRRRRNELGDLGAKPPEKFLGPRPFIPWETPFFLGNALLEEETPSFNKSNAIQWPSDFYNPGQNKLGHWQISVFSSCFLKYRGENIRLEPSHPPSPLIQCWDGRMAFDSTNIETGGAGGTESKTEVVRFCDLSQEF